MTDSNNSRRFSTALQMGILGGILLSRLAPPLIAQLRGMAGSSVGEDPFDLLIRQHKRLLSLLDSMENAADGGPARRAVLFLAFKRTIGKHAMAEEDVVYPLLHSETDRAKAAEQLYKEHAELKMHIFALQQNIQNPQQWRGHVRDLRDEISRHARQEEEVEFPRLRTLPGAAKSSFLNRNIRQEEALLL